MFKWLLKNYKTGIIVEAIHCHSLEIDREFYFYLIKTRFGYEKLADFFMGGKILKSGDKVHYQIKWTEIKNIKSDEIQEYKSSSFIIKIGEKK